MPHCSHALMSYPAPPRYDPALKFDATIVSLPEDAVQVVQREPHFGEADAASGTNVCLQTNDDDCEKRASS